ncbi:MAG: TnpV protein [Lachnospiraceae bacterium]|nr:TnpV protein [Lachnospiraceae bacterium]
MRTEPLMDFTYHKGSNGMLYPEIQISGEKKTDRMPAGRFGGLWKGYMMEKHPHRLSELVAQGKINEMIQQVDEEAERRKKELVQELLVRYPMPETEDLVARAGHLGMLTKQAEETVTNEVVMHIR